MASHLYVVHGSADEGRTHFCGLNVRASSVAAAKAKCRKQGLEANGVRRADRISGQDLASDRFVRLSRVLTA